jgi:hypothetical protein
MALERRRSKGPAGRRRAGQLAASQAAASRVALRNGQRQGLRWGRDCRRGSRRRDRASPLAPPQRKRATGFDRREDADEPLFDPVVRRQLAREVLLPRAFTEVLVRPSLARRHLPRVVLEPIRLGPHESLHVAPIDPVSFQKAGHGVATEERQVAAEQTPIEAREGALERVDVLGYELVPSSIAHELRREGRAMVMYGSDSLRTEPGP